MLGAGDAFMSRLPARLAEGTSRSRPAAPTPMPAAPSPSPACCARRKSRPGAELQFFLAQRQRRTARCARTRRSTMSIGRRRAARSRTASGARHRPSRAVRGDGGRGRRAARAHRRLQARWPSTPRARVAAGRPGFGMLLDGTYGREALFRRRRPSASGSAGPSRSRARARWTSSSTPGSSARIWPNGR